MSSGLILVTGGTGFTGSHLIRRLLANHNRIRAFARDTTLLPNSPHLETVEGDLRDQDKCEEAVRDVELVYHIAAAYRDATMLPSDYMAVNYGGTKNLFEACLRGGVGRFVHCSTVGVHGEIKGPAADETAAFSPDDAYQESKVATERFLSEHKDELELVVFRPTGIYGPGDRRLLKFFRMIAKGRFFMIGSGKVKYHLTYVEDLVDGIILCGMSPAAAGEIFILGGPEAPTLNEWSRIIADVLQVSAPRWHLPVGPFMAAAVVAETILPPFGITPPIFRRRMDFFTKNRAFDIGKARRVIGFSPVVGVREGMRRTAEWYAENDLI